MTLNGVIAFILRFSPNLIASLAYFVTVVEDRPIVYAKGCLPVPVFHFWPKLTQPAARSLRDSWATCHFSLWEAICMLWLCLILLSVSQNMRNKLALLSW